MVYGGTSLWRHWSGHIEDFHLYPKLLIGYEEGWHMVKFDTLKSHSCSGIDNGWWCAQRDQ